MMKRFDAPKVELLEAMQTFDGCTRQQLKRLARHLEEVRVPSGEQVVTEGSPGYHAFVLAEGLAHASIAGERIGTIQPGSFFGEIALLDGEPRTATVTTALPSRLLVFDRSAFDVLIRTAPTVASRVIREMAARLRHADEQLIARGGTES